ncbi:transcription elongation factor GreAB [Pseudomethylobacillus aquaticus]|uniref:Transcription elongation factor GreAB n=1 Tax=Pseudomethylobacillus aquaticus TaxID=2676064 RepID=A0A3N0V687_9PROT|nr:GreA/GreB family elongation factor [Pseudomethylobacillus aquaticus]ROH88306.1 transcription elongation factor GreAB [Pseudomethylobacillus aquaticus]
MSRGFVKEDDLEHAGTDLPERPLSPFPNYVTPTGLQQLQEQANLLEQQRVQLAPRKEDPVVQQTLARVERDLRYLVARLESAIPVEPGSALDTVRFGCTVEAEDETGALQQFQIVGEDEADIAAGKVSWVSPLAKALLGHKLGDSVLWPRPAGNLQLEIIDIR